MKMNPKKSGTVFIVFMIALIAFGIASSANVVNIGSNLFDGLNLSNSLNTQQQITAIGDPSFKPVYITKRAILNVTNNTPVTPTNNSTNRTIATNSGN
jgi:hypothetical protein